MRPRAAGGRAAQRTGATLDLDDYLPYLVNRVGVAIATAFGEALAAHRLSVPMWRVLAALAQHGQQRQVDLAGRTSIDASTLSRLLRSVEGLGYLGRARSAESQREVMVSLTARGRAVVQALIPIALAHERRAVEGLETREVDLLKRLLRRVYGNMAATPD